MRVLQVALLAASVMAVGTTAAQSAPLAFQVVKLDGARGSSEPRVTVTPDDRRYVVSNDAKSGNSIVFGSGDGGRTYPRTAGEPVNGASATIDVDIVSTRTNRIISSELDDQAISFITSYSDDRGKTWTQSLGGSQTGDSDRQWLAVGPDDPSTHKPRVYLLYHNLASGTGQHNMLVITSRDGGQTFENPVPVTLPPSQAYQDLQCADSGGPSSISVNPRTGQIYVVWGTRTAPALGGCGASIFGPFEINVVAATRVWVATSPDNTPGTWRSVLAVDDTVNGQSDSRIRGMQLAPGTLDNAGNFYVVYPESANQYPDYSGASINYKAFTPDLMPLAGPITVAAGGKGTVGHVLPHVVAGDPGKLDFAYYTGASRGDPKVARPVWNTDVTQTLDGLTAAPHFATTRLSDTPTYTGTASELMGACARQDDPTAGVQNGFTCPRSTDVWGVALDAQCRLTVTWPTRDNAAFAKGTARRPADPAFNAPGNDPGTFVATQTTGAGTCANPSAAGPGLFPKGSGAPGHACRDVTPPRSRFSRRRSRLTRHGIRLRGRSRDVGCTAQGASVKGEVAQVSVSIARTRSRKRCRFLGADGRLSAPRSCLRTSYLPAKGTTRWAFAKRVSLAPGRYKLWVRGLDTHGNIEHKRRRVNFMRAVVR